MKTFKLVAAASILAVAALAGQQAQAGVTGNYTRPDGTKAKIYNCGGKLCGKLTSGKQKGMEMLHGMAKVSKTQWKGKKMKHPDMPSFMTFNGTVTQSGNQVTVKGCMIGGAFCDREVWKKGR